MKSRGEHSTIARELTVDLAATSVLRWSWNMVSLPAGADLRRRETSDAAGHIFVVWRRPPAFLRSRLVGYVWDATLPVNTMTRSRKTDMVTFIVVPSGTARLGEWLGYERDVAADYRASFDEPPPNPSALALSIDTNDTGSAAETLVGAIAFATR